MEDTYKDKGVRAAMVRLMADKGIEDGRVLKAMQQVPRHWFVDTALQGHAYEDTALPIGSEQTISQPFTVAYQSQLLDAHPAMTVMEIGTGSGYQTAVLCAMGLKVFTIERQKDLFDKAKKTVGSYLTLPTTALVQHRPHFFLGDGYKGITWRGYGPFDRILVTCGAPAVPPELLKQLKIGGLMVIPTGDGDIQMMMRITKLEDDRYKTEQFSNFRFVPMLQDVNFNR
jgi:protein-L-isoaspartate(D-aspartate) O-methyltransferase